jgi:hypothetical protein
MEAMHRIIDHSEGSMKILGGSRFDSDGQVSKEWKDFGSYYMVLPGLELVRPQRMPVLVTWHSSQQLQEPACQWC